MPSEDDAIGILRERVKWRCRRGLLELDLMLTRFLARELESLDVPELEALLELLAAEDQDFWAWVSGRETCSVEAWNKWIAAIRQP